MADEVELTRAGRPGRGVDRPFDRAPPAAELQMIAAVTARVGGQEVSE